MTQTLEPTTASGRSSKDFLVSTDWVAGNLTAHGIRLVEVDVDTDAYNSGHISGAVGWNWKVDLQRRPNRDIPTRAEWEDLLTRSGISDDTLVLLYGDNHNWFAAFAYWLFKLYGHDDVKLIDGGRKKWLAEGRSTTNEVPAPNRATYQAKEADEAIRAYRDDVRKTIESATDGLVDVRSPGEFSGQLLAPDNLPQEGAQRGGHVPGAKNVPWGTAVAEDGTFKTTEELQHIYGGKSITPEKQVIA